MSTASFLAKLKKLEEYKFILPVLQEEITYRKLDIIESSINGQMPNFIASKVLDVMKRGINDTPDEDPQMKASDEDIKQLLVKATEIWQRVVISPELSMEQIIQIPSEDRIAWFMDAVGQSYTSTTTSGAEVTATEVANFPEEPTNKRNAKRSSDS